MPPLSIDEPRAGLSSVYSFPEAALLKASPIRATAWEIRDSGHAIT